MATFLAKMPSNGRRFLPVLAILAVFAIGLFLVFGRTTEEDRIRLALEELMASVEGKSADLLEARLHADYRGWGGSRANVLDAFPDLISRYDSVNLRIRDLQMDFGPRDETATARFEWTWRGILQTDTHRVDTRMLAEKWQPATTEFARGPGGRWQLVDLVADVPTAEP